MIIVISLLMVGRLPTYSLKGIRVAHRFVVPVMLGICLLAACLVGSPWMTLSVIGVLYFASLPLSCLSYRRRAARAAAELSNSAMSATEKTDAVHP